MLWVGAALASSDVHFIFGIPMVRLHPFTWWVSTHRHLQVELQLLRGKMSTK